VLGKCPTPPPEQYPDRETQVRLVAPITPLPSATLTARDGFTASASTAASVDLGTMREGTRPSTRSYEEACNEIHRSMEGIMGPSKVSRRVLVPLVMFVVLVVTKLWLHSSDAQVWFIVVATALIAAIDPVAEAHMSCAVFFFSSGLQMAIAVLSGGIGIAMLMLYLTPIETVPSVPFTAGAFIVGGLGGIFLRERFVKSCEQRRSGDSTDDVRLQLTLAVGLIVLLFPPGDAHAGSQPLYVVGVSMGFFVHFLTRRTEQRANRLWKLRRTIERDLLRLGMPAPELEPVEVDAIRLFARRRWGAIRALFRKHEAGLTFRLVLLKATVERVHGEDSRAVETLTPALAKRANEPTELDALAHVLLAMSYRELGRPREMWTHIAKAEELQPRCMLQRIFKALCLAEDLPSPGDPGWGEHESRRAEAKECLDSAFLLLREARKTCALASVVACGLPLTRRFVDDTFAYVSMKCGVVEPARTLLEACLREDSRSASSHLHLAECNFLLSDAALARGDDDLAERYRGAGDYCVQMALALSERRAGQTSRRARELHESRQRRTSRTNMPMSETTA